jgi:CBS domain containing-hemolysin-like protein
MKLLDLLAKMRREKTHIAIVIDEYGGTDGLVTIEDVMEALVGRIDDEHDQKSEYYNYKVINNSTIISNARVEVEVLEEIIGEKLKDDDEFDTIGGLVLTKMGNVPAVGTKINVSENIEIEVTDANPRSLKQVKITLKKGLKRAKSS